MYTVVETPTFQKQADKIWSEDERLEFIQWLARHPDAGDVIPGADGARKVRWAWGNSGKSGGVRVIYFNRTEEGLIWLITIYRKAEREDISAREIKKRWDDGH